METVRKGEGTISVVSLCSDNKFERTVEKGILWHSTWIIFTKIQLRNKPNWKNFQLLVITRGMYA